MSKTFSSGCGAGVSTASVPLPAGVDCSFPAGTDGLFPAGLEELLPAESDAPLPAEPPLDGALVPPPCAGVFPAAGFVSPTEEPVSAFAAPPCWAGVFSATPESVAVSEAVPGAASSFTSVAACFLLCAPPSTVSFCPPQPTSRAARQTSSKNAVAFFIRSPPLFCSPPLYRTAFFMSKNRKEKPFSAKIASQFETQFPLRAPHSIAAFLLMLGLSVLCTDRNGFPLPCHKSHRAAPVKARPVRTLGGSWAADARQPPSLDRCSAAAYTPAGRGNLTVRRAASAPGSAGA